MTITSAYPLSEALALAIPSKKPGSLGDGEIGLEVFARMMRDACFDDIPIILETPNPERWLTEISVLKKCAEKS